jgi:pimeloyl-ACP methyl ester carboxylesterase
MKRFLLMVLTFLSTQYISAQCNNGKLPIVFIHGFLASGDTYTYPIQRFIQNGYCAKQLQLFDWNSVSREKGNAIYDSLHRFIKRVLKETGAKQANLVGHSAGSGLGRAFLIDTLNAQLLNKYVHLAGNPWFFELPHFKNNRVTNIFSKGDMVVKGGGNIEGATNIEYKDKDHYEVATCEESFAAMHAFFNSNESLVVPTAHPALTVRGKAVVLGENTPLANARVYVYEVNKKDGRRVNKKNNGNFTVNRKGEWGPYPAERNKYYEFELVPADSSRVISYFTLPFTASNPTLYLRGFPATGMMAGMLKGLPQSKTQGLIVVFSEKKALIYGRDTMAIDNIPLSSKEYNPASKTIISSFLFDDGDGISSGKKITSLSMAPFLGGIDISLPANEKKYFRVMVNGRNITVPAEPSANRVMITVF